MHTSFEGLPYDEMAACLAEGKPLNELPTLDSQAWAAMYERAYIMYKYGRCAEAEPLFKLLCLSDPSQERYWIALGVVQKQQEKFDQAIASFNYAIRNGSVNPWAAVHAAECELRLGDKAMALRSLEQAGEWLRDRPDAGRLVQRIKRLLESVESDKTYDCRQTIRFDQPVDPKDTSAEMQIVAVARGYWQG